MTGKRDKLGKFLSKDIWEVFKKPASVTETGAEVGKTGLELALAAGLLGSPMAPVGMAIAGLSCVGLTTKGIKHYLDKTRDEPSLEECVVVASRLAYVESFVDIFSRIQDKDLLEKAKNIRVSEDLEQRTDNLQLSHDEARKVISCFRETDLAADLNKHLSFALKVAGINKQEVDIIIERITWNTQRYLNQALAEVGDSVKSLSGIFSDGYRQELEKFCSIDDYLEQEIAKKPKETVFAENFTFQDIYVPLEAQALDKNGKENENQQPVDLETWVQELLQNPKQQDKVIFIQGGPGRGKSVSCKMIADLVKQKFYPIWTPVLIRLRDIRTIEKQFENTLKAAVDRDFAANDDGWLTDKNIRYLFLLDGFDELLMEGRTSGGLEEFIKQVGSFQESCNRNPEKAHRVLITGRTLALQSIELEEIVFYPSGKAEENELTVQLLRVMYYCDTIQPGTFNNLLKYLSYTNLRGADLSGAYLRSAYLSGAYLRSADLSGADLRSADLNDAYLNDAYLRGAYLRDAYLSDVYLSGANLRGAYISDADLSGADLSGADLSGAYISDVDLSDADLSGADLSSANLSRVVFWDTRWDESTIWEGVRGLETAINVPEALKKQLGLSE